MTVNIDEQALAEELARSLGIDENASELQSLVTDIENASGMIASIDRIIAENALKKRKLVADLAGYKARLAALAGEG